MINRSAWLWLELVLCLPYAALLSIFGLALSTHWLVIAVFWGVYVEASSLSLTLYAAGTGLGIVSTIILLRTQLGATATRAVVRLTRLGLAAGFATSLLIPGGYARETWYDDMVLVPFAIVLPCLCFSHFAYLARRALFWRSS